MFLRAFVIETDFVVITGLRIIFVMTLCADIQTDRRPFKGLFCRTTWVSPYQKG